MIYFFERNIVLLQDNMATKYSNSVLSCCKGVIKKIMQNYFKNTRSKPFAAGTGRKG